MKLIITLLVTLIFTASCSKDDVINTQTDGNGVITALPYQWKKSLHNGNTFNSNGHIKYPIYYNGNIAIPTTNGENNRFLTMINPNNGETIWQWNDSYLPYSNQISIFTKFQYNNLLTYQTGTRSYGINLDNGTTQWKFQRDTPFDVRLYPNTNGTFFYNTPIINNDGFDEFAFSLANIEDGSYTEFVRANYLNDYTNPANLIGATTNIVKVPNENNLYAITYMEPTLNSWFVNTYLGLYNSDTEQWIYERKLMAPPTNNSSAYEPKIYNNKVYAWVGKNIVCHDLDTGDQIWRTPFPQDFLFSGFIIEDNKIIANNEDTYTYCLDPESGDIIWKTKTAGTSGRMSYLNGIVYFAGGSTGKLHAIDVNTGEHVWKLNSLDSTSFKSNPIYVFEAVNGNPAKIIALTHLNAYSFEAYQ